MSANKRQVAGSHYAKHGELQHWDVVDHFNLDYFQGQITKYVMRWKDKNGIEDLKKAQHFLEKYIELQKENPGAGGFCPACHSEKRGLAPLDGHTCGAEPGRTYVDPDNA